MSHQWRRARFKEHCGAELGCRIERGEPVLDLKIGLKRCARHAPVACPSDLPPLDDPRPFASTPGAEVRAPLVRASSITIPGLPFDPRMAAANDKTHDEEG